MNSPSSPFRFPCGLLLIPPGGLGNLGVVGALNGHVRDDVLRPVRARGVEEQDAPAQFELVLSQNLSQAPLEVGCGLVDWRFREAEVSELSEGGREGDESLPRVRF